MLKLFERLPDSITVEGKRYKCDFDFRNVLRMLDIMQRTDIMPDARDYLCARCCVKNAPKNAAKVYDALCSILFVQTPETGGKHITSYEQDAGLIRAAFRQVYGIDLYRQKLHWFEFTALLSCIPEGNRYGDVLSIRARPIPRSWCGPSGRRGLPAGASFRSGPSNGRSHGLTLCRRKRRWTG
jgi:hypothetical protein